MKWADEGETQSFAEHLSRQPVILNAQIALKGDLGAGKTTFVRHLLRALQVQGVIKSPTYGLVESYQGFQAETALNIWHMDFYRMTDPLEWEEAGLRDLFVASGLKIYEWPERVLGLLPESHLEIELKVNDDESRSVSLLGDLTLWGIE
jgi:tRNA threonylcarbamoyladenosine biosynthesis protein TsaE